MKINKVSINKIYNGRGEDYQLNGNNNLALVNDKKSLALNPENSNIKEMVKKFKKIKLCHIL